jgi:hypothetical protein
VLIQQHHYQAVPAVSNPDQHVYEAGSTYSASPGNENSAPASSLPRSVSQITFLDSKYSVITSCSSLFPLYSFLHSLLAYPLIGSNVLLNTLFSSILDPYVPLMWETMFCIHTKNQGGWCTISALDSIVNQQLIYRYSVYLLYGGKKHK